MINFGLMYGYFYPYGLDRELFMCLSMLCILAEDKLTCVVAKDNIHTEVV